jgi:hypothetical protein
MSDNSTGSYIDAASAGAAKNAVIDQNLSHELQTALTADKDLLFSVVQNAGEDVLMAALRNPSLDGQHLQALLKRRGLGNIPATIYSSKRLLESYPVKFALVCQNSSDSPQAAERCIIQRLPTQTLGNKLTLARRGSAAVVETLLREGLSNVVEACLDNPHLKEGSLHPFLSSAQATAETVSMIARHSRWKNRPNIRLAILKNPRTPAVWYTMFLPGLPPATLRDLLASPRLTFAQKELVRQAGHHR